MDLGLSGKRAAVAAASAGLGYASAEALVADGVRVAICGRDRARLEAAAARLGEGAVAVVADVGTPEGATGFVDRGHRGARRTRHPRHQRRRPSGRHVRHDEGRRLPLGPGAQPPVGGGDVPRRGAEHAGPGVGPRRGHHLDLRAPAHRQPHPVQHRPRRGDRLPEDHRPGGGRRRGHGQLGAAGPARSPTGSTPVAGDASDAKALGIPAGFIGHADDFGKVVAFLCSEPARFVTGAAPPGGRRLLHGPALAPRPARRPVS